MIASSPEGEIARTLADGRPSERDSGVPGRVERSSPKFPLVCSGEAAPYTTVWPSGANRASRMLVRRKVSCRIVGREENRAFQTGRPAKMPAKTAPRSASVRTATRMSNREPAAVPASTAPGAEASER